MFTKRGVLLVAFLADTGVLGSGIRMVNDITNATTSSTKITLKVAIKPPNNEATIEPIMLPTPKPKGIL